MAFYSIHVGGWGFSPNYSVTSAMAYNETDVFDRYGNIFSRYINCGIRTDIFRFISRPYRPSCSDRVNFTVINEYDFNYLSA